ncbi:hypothetical protein [Acinetobacter proteolyticus]|nr:hypothetical protein [Acinetobacter proteolyticus]
MENYSIEDYSDKTLFEFSQRLKGALCGVKFRVDVTPEFKALNRRLDGNGFDNVIDQVLELVGDASLFNHILAKKTKDQREKYAKDDCEAIFLTSINIYALNLRLRLVNKFEVVETIYFNNLVFNESIGAKISKRKRLDLNKINIKFKEIGEFFSKSNEIIVYSLSHLRLTGYFWRLCAIKSIFNEHKGNIFLLKYLISLESKLELLVQDHYQEEEQIEFIAQSKGGKARASNLEKTREPVYEEIKALWDTGKWKKATQCASDIHDIEGIKLPYTTVYNFILKYKKSKKC